MPKITQINSKLGLVQFSLEDIAEADLYKYIRTSLKSFTPRSIIAEEPFESAAAKVYVEKFPGKQVKIAGKCILNPDNTVDVILKIAAGEDKQYYNTHPNTVVISKPEKGTVE